MADTIFYYSDETTSTSSNTTIISSSRNTAKTLTSVIFGDTVTSIGANAFQSCTGLTTISIPNNITSLGTSAFFGCTNLTSVSIGSGVSTITTPYVLFDFCINLTNLTVDAANTTFASQNNVLCNKALNTILAFPQGITGTFSIPSNITTISNFAFYKARISQVLIPNNVTSIGSDAFNRSFLTSITIPSSVTSLGDWTCLFCPELVTATVNCSRIGYSMFRLCPKLTSVTINGTPPRFEGFAFGGSPKLKNINIPLSVTEIRENAFDSCFDLKSIIIPQNVTNVYINCFRSCTALDQAIFLGNAPIFGATPFLNTNVNLKIYRYSKRSGWSNTFDGKDVLLIDAPSQGLRTIGFGSLSSGKFSISTNFIKILSADIDSAIEGVTANDASMLLFSTANDNNGINPVYTRSTTCWAKNIDTSPTSVWTDGNGGNPRYNANMMTLISPRHGVVANHWGGQIPGANWANYIGAKFIFVAMDNTCYIRTFTASTLVAGTDIRVVLLDSDLPPNISFCKVASSSLASVATSSNRIPAMFQSYFPLNLQPGLRAAIADYYGGAVVTPANATRAAFYVTPYIGDSGRPTCFVYDNKLILLVTFYSSGGGPNFPDYIEEINSVMTALGGGYNLSIFNKQDFTSGKITLKKS